MPQLGMAPGPIERIRADLAVVPLFEGERPLRAAAGRVDWRLCGRLSHLLADGHLSGAVGEAVLIPGGGGVCAPRVLGLGAGRRA
jgi:Cytosol aminopeptidase family, N-terminal domain